MATPPIHLEHIVSLNNQGCDDLDQGNRGTSSLNHFRTALSAAKGILRAHHAHHHHQQQQPQYQKNNVYAASSRRPHLLQMPLHELQSNVASPPQVLTQAYNNVVTSKAHQTSQFFIYSSAMRIVPGARFSEDPMENCTIYTSFVVFNLALTLHLQGLRNCSRRCLEKAQSLYTHAYQLVQTVVNEYFRQGRPTENASFDLFVLALLNNTALIHVEFAEYGRAEDAFQRLMRFARISASFQKQQRSSCSEVVLKLVDSMLLNATFMCLNTIAAAAAA
jgi:hypothetical protein